MVAFRLRARGLAFSRRPRCGAAGKYVQFRLDGPRV